MLVVTGSPITPFADAFQAVLVADAPLITLLGARIYGQLPGAAATPYPYLAFGRASHTDDAGAAQKAGWNVSQQLDGWSSAKGPYEMERILSRVIALMHRRHLRVSGFEAIEGSLRCEFSEVFDEPDEDSPDKRLWHGVQRWSIEVHER